jgi:hypothetical protein
VNKSIEVTSNNETAPNISQKGHYIAQNQNSNLQRMLKDPVHERSKSSFNTKIETLEKILLKKQEEEANRTIANIASSDQDY